MVVELYGSIRGDHACSASLRSYDIAAAPRCRSATAGRKARDTAPGAELEQH
jgi:hypothetical protein